MGMAPADAVLAARSERAGRLSGAAEPQPEPELQPVRTADEDSAARRKAALTAQLSAVRKQLKATTAAQAQLELGELIFSPPVLIDATPGKNLGADSFAAIDVDPAGEATLIYGTGHWTSYLLRPT